MSIAAQITSTGILAPSYADILANLTISFQSIYGADAYISPDSQDGQLLAIFASAINDANQMSVAVYNSFSPVTAQGVGLSNVVKINGIQRLTASNSTAVMTIVGQNGTQISNGVVQDSFGNSWNLPSTVNIPGAGTITVTATCAVSGAITAVAHSINKIATPTRGWQSADNANPATVGAPVETDFALRGRQAISVALSALSVIDSIYAAIGNVSGVQRFAIYENATASTDGNGIPSHSISAVVEGGNIQVIGQTIAAKKTPGTGTYGSTSISVVDSVGIASTINFYVLAKITITAVINITALTGYVSTTGTALINSVIASIDAIGIGVDVFLSRLYTAANLNGSLLGETYNVTSILIARGMSSPSAADVAIAFNEAAVITSATITLNVT